LIVLLAALLSFGYSPGDSSWSLVTLNEIPDRAILFAELAAKDGGRPVIDLAAMLEIAGRFSDADRIYSLALNSASDPLVADWLENRIAGSRVLDTLVTLSAVITNSGTMDATDITVEIPLPQSHPPYQSIEILAAAYLENEDLMTFHLDSLKSGTSVTLPLILHICQQPYTFRPLPASFQGTEGTVRLERIAAVIRAIQIPETDDGPGPCLEIAFELKDRAIESDLELQVTGGLLRTGGDTLLFHAWNLMTDTGTPVDATLFHADSMRGIGHCPSDIIPLWNFEPADGHEISIFYPQQDIQLEISMQASFADLRLIYGLLTLFPFSLIARK
jgi:hypothetical protein